MSLVLDSVGQGGEAPQTAEFVATQAGKEGS